jgi:hypothetical protein
VRSINLIIVFILLLIKLTGCQAVKNKTDEIVKIENEKLSQFIGKPASELKIVMGLPNNEEKSDTGKKVFVYKTKKYGIPCERKFEISDNDMVIGFVSKGCF